MKSKSVMTKEKLIAKLKKLEKIDDLEVAHYYADALLLEYINDADISKTFNDIDKWYA
jgi:hypothetical protein